MNSIKVKVNKTNRDKLKNLNDYSIDRNLNILMDSVEKDMPFVKYSDEMTSLNLHKSTIERLDSFKICNGESRDCVLTRLLLCHDKHNKHITEYWIPFRLTSRLNKLLSIKCMIEINTSLIVFDEGNAVYDKKLPTTYKVNGEDLSKEFQTWIEMLDWNVIKQQVINNDVDLFTLKQPYYFLEVNYL